jgi:hypothetical protein
VEEVEYYRKNEVDAYAFLYFPKEEMAVAYHMPVLPPGLSGSGTQVVTLENIKSRQEAIEKLREAVDGV